MDDDRGVGKDKAAHASGMRFELPALQDIVEDESGIGQVLWWESFGSQGTPRVRHV